MAENLLVGSHKHTSKEYSGGYDQITKTCECGKVLALGEKCPCQLPEESLATVLKKMTRDDMSGEWLPEFRADMLSELGKAQRAAMMVPVTKSVILTKNVTKSLTNRDI